MNTGHISKRCIHTLLQSLWSSYRRSIDYDCKPGLKFLIQKVGRINRSANLYRQTAVGLEWEVVVLGLEVVVVGMGGGSIGGGGGGGNGRW